MTKTSKLLFASFLFSGLFAHADLIPASRPLPAGAYAATKEPQEVLMLDSGTASFGKRLQLIENAKKSIETEFYIFNPDEAGRLYTQALIRKAQQGVRVRILVDEGFGTTNLSRYHAKVLAENGIEVRFYNQQWLINFKQANHRNHRKTLIVDNEVAVIGGRNMADEYFDFSSKLNYFDRDVAIRGSIVREIAVSFENFWNSPLSKSGLPFEAPRMQEYGISSLDDARQRPEGMQIYDQYRRDLHEYHIKLKEAQQFTQPRASDSKILQRIHYWAGQINEQISAKGTCTESYFYSDLPGHQRNARVVFEQMHRLLGTAQKSIVVESPFFIQREPENMFKKALARGVKVDVLTNSLRSSDMALTVGPFFATAKVLGKMGATVYVYEGDGPSWLEFVNPDAQFARWGTHAKSFVIDDNTILIGSYNLDPRSKYLNSELAFVCRGNKELAEGLATDFERRKSIMVQLNENGDPVDGRPRHFGVDERRKFIYFLTKPLAFLFEHLL